MNQYPLAAFAVILFTVSACQSGIEPTAASTWVPVQLAYRASQCHSDSARIAWIQDTNALTDWWQPFAKQQFPAKSLPQSLGAIDFDLSAVFILFMGSQPTAGYDIELRDDRARVAQTELTIFVTWRQPSADAILAQVMTSPCIVIAVPTGPYETVTVQDQQGKMRLIITRAALRN